MNRLESKLAIVTGALGQLGPHWCQALQDEGATVITLDVRPGADCVVDITRSLDLFDVQATILEKYGRVPDVLVNNAGVDFPPGIENNGGRYVLEVNIMGTYNMLRVFGEAMCSTGRGGSIINIGSLYGSVAPDPRTYPFGFDKPALYGASKAAVHSLTKHYAVRWASFGVRVNTLSPGGVYNNQSTEFVERYNSHVPLGHMALPEDITGALVFLASEESRYLTGQEIMVDGGYSVW